MAGQAKQPAGAESGKPDSGLHSTSVPAILYRLHGPGRFWPGTRCRFSISPARIAAAASACPCGNPVL